MVNRGNLSRVTRPVFRLAVTAFVFSLIGLAFLYTSPDAYLPKHGKVVDQQTGKAISHVAVIATATFQTDGFLAGPGGSDLIYRVIVRTDDNGDYLIPATWSKLKLGIPGVHWSVKWYVTAIEPGFSLEIDNGTWGIYDTHGASARIAHSIGHVPEGFTRNFTRLELTTLALAKPDWSLKDAAVYYARLYGAGKLPSNDREPENEALRRQIASYLYPWLCSKNPQDLIDGATGNALLYVAADWRKAMKRITTLEPMDSKKVAYDRSNYHVGNICIAVGEDQQ